MKKILLSILPVIFVHLAIAQQSNEKEAISFVKSVFTPGAYKFEAMAKDVPQDMVASLETYTNVLAQRKDWYKEYAQKYKNKKVVPYHKNFVITKAEYERLMNEYPNLPMKVKGVADVEITQSGDSLKFTGKGTFNMLNGLVIDVRNNVLEMNEQRLNYKGPVAELDGVGKVKAYAWKFEYSNLDTAFKNFSDYSLLELKIGKKNEDGTTAIVFTNKYVELGDMKINGTITGYLK